MDTETRRLYIDILERRRGGIDTAAWQVQSLTLVAQTFLLQVITDKGVGWVTASFTAAAGVLTSCIAGLVLWHQFRSERAFSDAITTQLATVGAPDPRGTALLPAAQQRWARPRATIVYCGAILVLLALICADVFGLILTRS